MESLPILVILYAGLTHAMEADHVLAISNIVSQRKSILPALKDGIFWGLGHTSTILVIGLIILVFKTNISGQTFSYFEAAVGLMLILVAIYRLVKFFKEKEIVHHHVHVHKGENVHEHFHAPIDAVEMNLHNASYGIGLVHGLAGSGALVALVMTQFKTTQAGILYLFLFGMGSVIGMMLVSGAFSIPFSKKAIHSPVLRTVLVLVSSLLCFGYGAYVMYENLIRN